MTVSGISTNSGDTISSRSGGIVAMFRCDAVKISARGPGQPKYETITLFPITGPENAPWSQFTPSGSCELTVTNPAAMGKFMPGCTYRLTFSQDSETAAIDARNS